MIKETILVLVATILFNANKPHSFSVRLVFSYAISLLSTMSAIVSADSLSDSFIM